MNSYLLSYITHCVLGLYPSTELCEEVMEIPVSSLQDYRLRNILKVIKGGNPTSPELQKEVVFMLSLECSKTLSM